MKLTYCFNDNDFEYEVDVPEKLKFEILAEYYSVPQETIKKINDDFEFDDDRFFEMFEDELKNEYEDEAFEAYKDSEAYNSDPLGYYGMKQSDFI